MATKRPALSAILGAGTPIALPKDAPALAPPPVAEAPAASAEPTAAPERREAGRVARPRPARRADKAISRRAAGHVQLNVLLPSELRKQAKMKALQQDKDLSEVIETLLEKWVGV